MTSGVRLTRITCGTQYARLHVLTAADGYRPPEHA